jgi:hypothetical protein
MRRAALPAALLAVVALVATAQAQKLVFDEALIPHFNVPRVPKPPTIDGAIDPDEWRQAAKVMGMVRTHGKEFRDRPVAFWVAWDPEHLYIAARSDILPGHRLYRNKRERYTTGTVFDDAYEFGLFLHDRNKLPGHTSSYMKFIINSLGSGEYMKLYPSIGQNLFNWRPEMDIANRIHKEGGKEWWDLEIAADLEDLQMPAEHKAGDPVWLLLAADLKNPQWQWLDFPSASGHLEHYGFPRLVLTEARPYVQIDQIAGLHDERLDLKMVIRNPSSKPAKVKAAVRILHGEEGPQRTKSNPENPRTALDETKALTIPPKGSVPVEVHRAFPGLDYPKADRRKAIKAKFSVCDIQVTLADQPDAPPFYT